ncbi:hypothetical protein [Roseomonas fluvialis]|uniref:Uncharacterized protein n=1 Tax=Roseomonas fluvialis TaxID=1750527 RepID=A0ABN6P575_9PROT|nr:hypothetical protein [Roseomonas fluvialis]BDG72455.1 hypothetical protein Rmf_23840 [Roseomonas fluvialis]
MSSTLVSALHSEERSIIEELRASKPFQRLEGIHKLLSLYDAKPSVAVSLGAASADADRGTAPVIQLAPPLPASMPIAMPGPVGSEAPAAEMPRNGTTGAPMGAVATSAVAQEEPAGVVSSVRAALLGIGKA